MLKLKRADIVMPTACTESSLPSHYSSNAPVHQEGVWAVAPLRLPCAATCPVLQSTVPECRAAEVFVLLRSSFDGCCKPCGQWCKQTELHRSSTCGSDSLSAAPWLG